MAASIASPGRPTPSTISRPGSISKSKLFAKPDAAKLLRAELGKRGYQVRPIAMGTNTDPYQPIEGKWRITRSMLEVLAETSHPVTITTKSDRVLMDLDLLDGDGGGRAGQRRVVGDLADPGDRAHAGAARAGAAQAAGGGEGAARGRRARPGWRSRRSCPAITDHELEHIVEAAAEAGALGVFYLPVRLPFEVAPLFRAWLDEHFPDRAGKVMAIIQSLRGGRDNDPDFFSRMRGSGPWADLLKTRFERAVPQARPQRREAPAAHATCSSRRRARSCGCSRASVCGRPLSPTRRRARRASNRQRRDDPAGPCRAHAGDRLALAPCARSAMQRCRRRHAPTARAEPVGAPCHRGVDRGHAIGQVRRIASACRARCRVRRSGVRESSRAEAGMPKSCADPSSAAGSRPAAGRTIRNG